MSLDGTLPCSCRPVLTLGMFLFLFFFFPSHRRIVLFGRQVLIPLLLRFIVFYSWISSSFPRPPAKRAVALAAINAFSQLGNVAGSYVWGLSEDGFRKSYGIVTAMFGVTIVGCYVFKLMLNRLNQQLEQEEMAETVGDQASTVAGDEGLRARKGFRYLV